MAILNSWRGGRAIIFSLQFAVFSLATCEAAEPPKIANLKQAHARLRTNAEHVQGVFRQFRSETVIRAALEKRPSDLAIPLVRSGNIWRSKQKFRADFVELANGLSYSFAMEGDRRYEFCGGNLGTLRICEAGTDEAAEIKMSVETTFLTPIDSLWSQGNGQSFVDVVQRPHTEIRSTTPKVLTGGLALHVSLGDGSEAQLEFEPRKDNPFGYLQSTAKQGDLLITAQRRVYSVEKKGKLYPQRVVTIASFGLGKGYTEVIILDLESLQDNSPIAHGITSASFQNFRTGYQVYRVRESGKQELGERYGGK